MNERAEAHVALHAPKVREEIAGIMQGLEDSGVNWHDVQSFGAEVAASLLNHLTDRLIEHRKELNPHRQLGHAEVLNIMVSDAMNRAQLRKLRRADP
jgi:hypothetical protein